MSIDNEPNKNISVLIHQIELYHINHNVGCMCKPSIHFAINERQLQDPVAEYWLQEFLQHCNLNQILDWL